MNASSNESHGKPRRFRRLPRSFKELTPSNHFSPRAFFYEMVWKALLTPRVGESKRPVYPRLKEGDVAITWIGHASFLIQFSDLNILVDPNFANWLFLLKRIRRAGIRVEDLPPIDVVLLTHSHFDHFHKPSLRKIPPPRTAVMPWGVGELARGLGFGRIIELNTWESFATESWRVTFAPAQHWGARTLHDGHRGYGGFVLEHQGRCVYHAGDTAYFKGFQDIGLRCKPEIAFLPIGAYYPDSFRKVHMGPDEAMRAFEDLGADWFVPMHYGTFKLSFEPMEAPEQWLRNLAKDTGRTDRVRILEPGVPTVF
ncbi:MAG: MBL fold metallo-hydrolase [Verrucomicrobia bacterium]|nr:MBL fold metallo-hydrolase [Verrucomicrobiota bacterium]